MATIGDRLNQLFLDSGELTATQARQEFKSQGKKTSYKSLETLFYVLRELGLIEFVREEQGKARIDMRFYRITPGAENDPRWKYPHQELYPSSKIPSLEYQPGSSTGRSPEYAKTDEH